jgi:hypothetical protein
MHKQSGEVKPMQITQNNSLIMDSLTKLISRAALTGNALTGNALTGNALTGNALTGNALTGNALTGNAIASRTTATREEGCNSQHMNFALDSKNIKYVVCLL